MRSSPGPPAVRCYAVCRRPVARRGASKEAGRPSWAPAFILCAADGRLDRSARFFCGAPGRSGETCARPPQNASFERNERGVRAIVRAAQRLERNARRDRRQKSGVALGVAAVRRTSFRPSGPSDLVPYYCRDRASSRISSRNPAMLCLRRSFFSRMFSASCGAISSACSSKYSSAS